MKKNAKNLKFTVNLERPHCRTPIKPVIRHKNDAEFSRKVKYKQDFAKNLTLEY